MKRIVTTSAPTPAGHYSQAIVAGGMLFVSGQLPFDPVTGKLAAGPIEDEARLALANLRAVVEAAGCSLTDIAKVSLYVSDITVWPRVNRVYAEFFGDHRPARAVIPCGPLHYGAQIEIEAVAEVRRAPGPTAPDC